MMLHLVGSWDLAMTGSSLLGVGINFNPNERTSFSYEVAEIGVAAVVVLLVAAAAVVVVAVAVVRTFVVVFDKNPESPVVMGLEEVPGSIPRTNWMEIPLVSLVED
eukprot:TRINITY_DN384_c0_g1_i12.p2 TRINITY_DN384_c0_g1~~TRINITY_DN384_c0_g1_i12.p2  ORF type:complete len:106 (+),score=25.21 TRINITY_DN384_c0_g1_i12:983-1300(+)